MCAAAGSAPRAEGPGPYRVLKTADVDGRRLYIARRGTPGRINVFDLDTLAPAGEIPNANAHGVAVDPSSHHAKVSGKTLTLDQKTGHVLVIASDYEPRPAGTAPPAGGKGGQGPMTTKKNGPRRTRRTRRTPF